MNQDERQKLREAALAAAHSTRSRSPVPRPADWKLQTSNSFRRIGSDGDGDVLCGTKHPIDAHPDLLAASGVLDYVVAAQPRVVLALLDDLDAAALALQQIPRIADAIDTIQTRLDTLREALGAAVVKLSATDGVSLDEVRGALETFLAALLEVQQ
jgi:hypothetical protein